MKRFPTPRNSLVTKLVLAFILAAVPPMLLAGKMVGGLVNQAVNRNMEHWLKEGMSYIFMVVDDMRSQLSALYMLERGHFAQKEVRFDPGELEAVHELGADFLVLADEQRNILFSSPEPYTVDAGPVFPGSPYYMASFPGSGEKKLAIVEKRTLTAEDGSLRELTMGAWFSLEFSDSGLEPLELRIFLPEEDGQGFKQAYSSKSDTPLALSRQAVDAVLAGAGEYFLPEPDWTDNEPDAHYLCTVRRNEQGEITALFVISILMRPFDRWNIDSTMLFWMFLLLGTILSGGVGYLLAQGVVWPIKRLNDGVRQVANGKLQHHVPVRGNDEVAELSANFNIMSDQLEIARHESIETTRQERARLLGEIAIGFAHEIRNPLVVIKTSAELVRNTLSAKQKEARLMDFVVEEVGRINALLTEFLTFAKPVPLKLEPFPLKLLVESVLQTSAPELARRGITWSVTDETGESGKKAAWHEGRKGAANVIGDQARIRQVLLNLVLNAMDAMPDGGRLDVRLYGSEDGSMLYLELRDTGKGIPDGIAASIHLPFKSTKKSGLGLGLAVVYAIMEAHGGQIRFMTRAGQGTTFTLGLKR